MKIGILTFHWATNYGAVLQCYALQTYLESLGHEVKVINYKPNQLATKISLILHSRSWLEIKSAIITTPKERALQKFREENLHLTHRLYSCAQIPKEIDQMDVIISGSDQVLSTSFLTNGDGKNKFTPSYYLGFPFNGKKITYAASFGCTKYPENLINRVRGYVAELDYIGVREATGEHIMMELGRNDSVVVPDPTLLLSNKYYINLTNNCNKKLLDNYVYCFFIRNIEDRRLRISNVISSHKVWNNDDNEYSLEGWLKNIKEAKFVITDSFHCVMMCLQFHINFVVITEVKGNEGMNDRLYTILGKLSLSNHIVFKGDLHKIPQLLDDYIEWDFIDKKLSDIRDTGISFFNKCLNK